MHDTITQVIEGTLSVEQAALILEVTPRTIYRRTNAYVCDGIGSFSHGLKGRTPANALDIRTWNEVLMFYENKYEGYNWRHFRDMLEEREGILVSYATVYTILSDAGLRSPKAHRRHRRNRHPFRGRRKHFGELVQMDASKHVWFGRSYTHLHLAIDDATSQILAGFFCREETLVGYYQVFSQILRRFGVPKEFYTDRRSIFEYAKKGEGKLERDHHTQFQLAAAQLGVVRINTTSVPQAKGRIERAFGTFQDRLINEMATDQIKTIEEANEYLVGFITRHNLRFALDEEGLESAFGQRPDANQINLALAIVAQRKVQSGCIISYRNKRYFPYSVNGHVYLPVNTEAIVIKALDDSLYVAVDKKMWPLIEHGQRHPKHIAAPRGGIYSQQHYEYLIKRFRKAA
jgi:transposase